jgi:hypothetical protein
LVIADETDAAAQTPWECDRVAKDLDAPRCTSKPAGNGDRATAGAIGAEHGQSSCGGELQYWDLWPDHRRRRRRCSTSWIRWSDWPG